MTNSYNDFNKALIQDLRVNGGRASAGPFRGGDVLILTTKGAKTGAVRENPLAYSRDNGHLVVIASKRGSPENPSWYHNLVANPTVTVEVLGEKFDASARVTEGDEYERLFQQHARKMPGFNQYRRITSRKMPVIVLERIGSGQRG